MKYDPEERLMFTQIEDKMKDLSARAPAPSPTPSPPPSPSTPPSPSPPPSPSLTDDESDHRFDSCWKCCIAVCKRQINGCI